MCEAANEKSGIRDTSSNGVGGNNLKGIMIKEISEKTDPI